ncbi:hypothetical protein AAG906_040404 [Vitis piasezkii]
MILKCGRCSLHKSSRPHILRPSSGSINTGFSGHAMDPGPCLLMGCFAILGGRERKGD